MAEAAISYDRPKIFDVPSALCLTALLSCTAVQAQGSGGSISAAEIPPAACEFDREVARSDSSIWVRKSLGYLRHAMDLYHNSFIVYDGPGSPGNHFFAWAKIPSADAPALIRSDYWDADSGSAGIQAAFFPRKPNDYAGFLFLNGSLEGAQTRSNLEFGDSPAMGIDLRDALALTFKARSEHDGGKVDFFVGGAGWNAEQGIRAKNFPDSSARTPDWPSGTVTLSDTWQQYRIDLSKGDRSYVLNGFGWAANRQDNPQGVRFYLDDIVFELSKAGRCKRLAEPRLIRSFTTREQGGCDEAGQFDTALSQVAFTYDNALAVLAFLAARTEEGRRRAEILGDAFVYAINHDRYFTGGCLRTAYRAGDFTLPPGWRPNGRIGAPAIPGFYPEELQRFLEVEQEKLDVGNNAWAMIALLALYQRTEKQSYLDGAEQIGHFIRWFRDDSSPFRGFRGAIGEPEAHSLSDSREQRQTPCGATILPDRKNLSTWSSTEHNIDVFAAFSTLARLTGDTGWRADAEHAEAFIQAMRYNGRRRGEAMDGCIFTGTGPDKDNTIVRNEAGGMLPIDVHTWSVLALGRTEPEKHAAIRRAALQCAERFHCSNFGGRAGCDFNEDRDGVWYEGTAQMALAYKVLGDNANAERLLAVIRAAQVLEGGDAAGGIPAADRNGLSTGFVFRYYKRAHVGATAWHVFAETGFNPYYDY